MAFAVVSCADEEIIVDHFLQAGLGDDHGNEALFAHGAVLDADVDTGLVFLVGDLDMLGGLACFAAGVLAQVESTCGLAGEIGDLFQQFAVNGMFGHALRPPLVNTGQAPRVSVRILGRMSSAEPLWVMVPPPMTMTSSAREMMRS